MMFVASQINSDQKYLIISLITIGFSLAEVATMGGFNFSLMDVAPEYIGVLQGLNLTIGLTPGFIVPVIISLLTPMVS